MIDRLCLLAVLCAVLGCGPACRKSSPPPPTTGTASTMQAPREQAATAPPTQPVPEVQKPLSPMEPVQTVLVEQDMLSGPMLTCQEQSGLNAEDLTVNFDARVQRIRWYGFLASPRHYYQSHEGLHFRLRVYRGDGQVPSGEPFYQANLFSPGREWRNQILEFQSELPKPLLIRACQKLWISLSCLDSSDDWTWQWCSSGLFAVAPFASKAPGGAWQACAAAQRRAYTLEGLRPARAEPGNTYVVELPPGRPQGQSNWASPASMSIATPIRLDRACKAAALQWYLCTVVGLGQPDSLAFHLTFYEDGKSSPGKILRQCYVSARKGASAYITGPVGRYDCDLDPPVDLPAGRVWLSIQIAQWLPTDSASLLLSPSQPDQCLAKFEAGQWRSGAPGETVALRLLEFRRPDADPTPAPLYAQPLGKIEPKRWGVVNNDQVVYENADAFALVEPGKVKTVRWWGGFLKDSQKIRGPVSFEVRFYADEKGLPGAEICKQTVQASVRDTQRRLDDLTGVIQGPDIHGLDIVYQFQADLAKPLELPAGKFWLSVNLLPNQPIKYWCWDPNASTDKHIHASRTTVGGKPGLWSQVKGELPFMLYPP